MIKKTVTVLLTAVLLLLPIDLPAKEPDIIFSGSFSDEIGTVDYIKPGILSPNVRLINNTPYECKLYIYIAVFSETCDRITDVLHKSVTLDGENRTFDEVVGTVDIAESAGKVSIYVLDNFVSPVGSLELTRSLGDATDEALEELSGFFGTEVLDWLASLYSPQYGGFYYSGSARDYEGFYPDIESSAQAYDILSGLGVLDGKPLETDTELAFRDGLVNFMQSRQDSDGYFYDIAYGKEVSNSKRERNLSQAKSTINRWNAEYEYMLPFSSDEQGPLLMSSDSFETLSVANVPWESTGFEAWMRNQLPWVSDPYSAAHTLVSAKNQIKQYGYLENVYAFLEELQSTQTGLFGGANNADAINYSATNCAMKLSYFFSDEAHPIPYPQLVAQSTIKAVLSDEVPDGITSVWNPLVLLKNLILSYKNETSVFSAQLKNFVKMNMPAVIEKTTENLRAYKRSDGGCSYCRGWSSPYSQSVRVSLGLDESDMNATTMGTQGMISPCYWLTDREKPSYSDKRDYFFSLIENAQDVTKKHTAKTPISGFDYSVLGNIGEGVECNNTAGSVALSNSALKFETHSGGNTSLTFPLASNNAESYTLECEFSLAPCSANSALFYNSFGNSYSDAIQWGIETDSSGTYRLFHRPKASNSSATYFADGLTFDTPYSLRIEYVPDSRGGACTRFYLNGIQKNETYEYYNMESGKNAETNISRMKFTAFSSANATLSIMRAAMYDNAVTYSDDFEDNNLTGWNISSPGDGSVSIETVDADSDNLALRIKTNTTGNIYCEHSAYAPQNFSDAYFECKIKVDYLSGASFYNPIGSTCVHWCVIKGSANDKFRISNRRYDRTGDWETRDLDIGKWYTLKIRYSPRGLNDSELEYFVDGISEFACNGYYNGGNQTALPSKLLDKIRFNSFMGADCVIWIDDIFVYCEKG